MVVCRVCEKSYTTEFWSSCIIGSKMTDDSILTSVCIALRVSYVPAGDKSAQVESCIHVYQFGYSCDVPAPCFHIDVYNDLVSNSER